MQYTIESRKLSSAGSQRPATGSDNDHTIVEARSTDEAVSSYVLASASELVSLVKPTRSREAIATVRKADGIFLLRVYTD